VGEDVGEKVPVGSADGLFDGTLLVGASDGSTDGDGDGPVGIAVGGFVSPDWVGAEVIGEVVGASVPVGDAVGRVDGAPD